METPTPTAPFTNPLKGWMVVGIAFDFSNDAFVLMRKNRPKWMAGQLNGVGGKINPDETPAQAMAREFEEETGVHTEEKDWHLFHCEMRNDGPVLFFFTTDLFGIGALVRTVTDEAVLCFNLTAWNSGLLKKNRSYTTLIFWYRWPRHIYAIRIISTLWAL
jgi:8-oxo-dGTP pyrophosphatase MutT (NUDIX family)